MRASSDLDVRQRGIENGVSVRVLIPPRVPRDP